MAGTETIWELHTLPVIKLLGAYFGIYTGEMQPQGDYCCL